MYEALGKQMKPRPARTLRNPRMDRYATARMCSGRQLFTGKYMQGHGCVRGVLVCICSSNSMKKAFQTWEANCALRQEPWLPRARARSEN